MAKNTVTHYIDDLDGSMEDVRTVSFTYGGSQYQIELSEKNRRELDDLMQRYILAARKFRGNPAQRGKLPYGRAREIREWAVREGLLEPGKSTGRLPEKLIREFLETQRAAQQK